MNMQFYFLLMYSLIIFLSISIITSRNPVIAVIFPIVIYCLVSLIFISIGAEFIALLSIIVYAGAISVLFLFVVMMLNVRLSEIRNMLFTQMPICGLIGLIFIFELVLINYPVNTVSTMYDTEIYVDWINLYNAETDIMLLGQLLINYYFLILLLAGIILLLAMIGSIALTLEYSTKIEKRLVGGTRVRFFGIINNIIKHGTS